MLLTLSSSH